MSNCTAARRRCVVGRTITAVKIASHPPAVEPASFISIRIAGRPCAYYTAISDIFMIYPWEMDRSMDKMLLGDDSE